MADLYKHARRYAQHGIRVLMVWGMSDGVCRCRDGKKCRTPGKHPIHGAWQKLATTDLKKLRRWCREYPAAHLGIMPKEGTCILDIDPRNGGLDTFEKLMDSAERRRTVMQRSGGGGYHLFYRGEPSGPLGDGIDVKRPGRGYVVAAPSGHVSGGTYKWKKHCAPWEMEYSNAKIIFQVKSGGVKRGDIATLRGDMGREDAALAVLITLEEPSRPMLNEAKAAGQYKHEEMGRSYDRISIVTVREIVEKGERLEIPMSVEVLKAAQVDADSVQHKLI